MIAENMKLLGLKVKDNVTGFLGVESMGVGHQL